MYLTCTVYYRDREEEKSFTAAVTNGGKILKFGSGQKEFEFHAVWLRKHCNCPKCLFSSRGDIGRLIYPHELDPSTTLVSVEISGKLYIGSPHSKNGIQTVQSLPPKRSRITSQCVLYSECCALDGVPMCCCCCCCFCALQGKESSWNGHAVITVLSPLIG